MIQILLLILLLYGMNLFIKRGKKIFGALLHFEGEVEEYKIKIRTTYCPEVLKKIYGELLDLHNQKAEFIYQKRNVKKLINIVHRRIEALS